MARVLLQQLLKLPTTRNLQSLRYQRHNVDGWLQHLMRYTTTAVRQDSQAAEAIPAVPVQTTAAVPTPAWAKSPLDEKLSLAPSLPVLLKTIETESLQPQEVCNLITILSKWVASGQVQTSEFENDMRYKKACAILGKPQSNLQSWSILHAVMNLYNMGIAPNNYIIQSLETDLLWKLRRASVKLLLKTLVFYVRVEESSNRTKFLNEVVDGLEKRWVELTEPADIATAFTYGDMFSAEFMNKLEDRAVGLVESMPSAMMVKMFCMLAEHKRRPKPLLRALAFRLGKDAEKLNIKSAADLLYAMNTLNFVDNLLIEKVCSDIISSIGDCKSSIVGSILISLGQMRYLHKELLECISEWILAHSDDCRTQDVVSYILTLSSVNYKPAKFHLFVEKILPKLTESAISNMLVWLDVVFSLTVLESVTQEHLSSVLKPQFAKRIFEMDGYQAQAAKMKLLNINASAKLECSPYKGLLLESSVVKDNANSVIRNQDPVLMKSVIDAISNFVPSPKYLRAATPTHLGVFVDGECALDKRFDPLPLTEYSTDFSSKLSLKPLPSGAARIVIFVWDYKSTCLGSSTLTGTSALHERLLRKAGYSVLHVLHNEYNPKEKLLIRVQYIEQQLKALISKANSEKL